MILHFSEDNGLLAFTPDVYHVFALLYLAVAFLYIIRISVYSMLCSG